MRQLFQYHPTIGYQFIPGLKARVLHENGGYLVRVNDMGFRSNREYVRMKKPGTRRILLFGDSFTAGDGVPNDKRYSDVLETLVPNLEVYNYGLPGAGTDQQYLTYKECAQGFDHDLLLIAVLVENVKRVANGYRYWVDESGAQVLYAKPFYKLVQGELRLSGVPVPWKPVEESQLSPEDMRRLRPGIRFPRLAIIISLLGMREIQQRLMEDIRKRLGKYQPVPEYNDPADPAWCLMRAILIRWIREHPKPVLLMPIPGHFFVEETSDPTAYQERFREVREATGCFFHDPLEDLLTYPLVQRRAFRYAKDPHLTPAGHIALAKSLKSAIVRVLQ